MGKAGELHQHRGGKVGGGRGGAGGERGRHIVKASVGEIPLLPLCCSGI